MKHGRPALILALSIPGLIFLPFAIAALVIGIRHQKRFDKGLEPDSKSARTGLILGGAGIIIGLMQLIAFIYLLPALLQPDIADYEKRTIEALEEIYDAQSRHFRLTGEYADEIETLRKRDFIQAKDEMFLGYRIELIVPEDVREFEVRAHPLKKNVTGNRHFYVDQTGKVRWAVTPDVGKQSQLVHVPRT